MNEAVLAMLKKYTLKDLRSQENALKEIIQEIALLGLWRAKFFEKAAFYGGSALRILYGLDRFSEDLDFSLLKDDSQFDLTHYHSAVYNELTSFGFSVQITEKKKSAETAVQSAFIKADTLEYIFEVYDNKRKLKIKFEVDTTPPGNFSTEVKYLLNPIEFFVKTFSLQDIFAGKLHAVLFRNWKNRVKGRDWYDLIWFIKNETGCNLKHLKERMRQSKNLSADGELDKEKVIKLLKNRIESTDFNLAKEDIAPFIHNRERLDIWSKEFFLDLTGRMKFYEKD